MKPPEYHTILPHLIVSPCAEAIDFYKKAFGAEETFRMPGPDGRSIMHAEIRIGDSAIMLADEMPGMTSKTPKGLGGSPVTIHIYTKDCDAVMKQAEEAGATVTMPAMDAFWGDRYGRLKDPFGHEWSVAHRVKVLSPEEVAKAAAAAFGGGGPGCES